MKDSNWLTVTRLVRMIFSIPIAPAKWQAERMLKDAGFDLHDNQVTKAYATLGGDYKVSSEKDIETLLQIAKG